MADPLERLSQALQDMLRTGGRVRAIPSAAPGGGPSSEREGAGVAPASRPLGTPPTYPPHGGETRGYGGHGDPVLYEEARDVPTDLKQEIAAALNSPAMRASRQHEVRPRGRVRLNQEVSAEGHTAARHTGTLGPFSLYEGSFTPTAGTAVLDVPITIPNTTLSPVTLLNRYPGALYFKLRVSSIALMPTAATMTGILRVFFSDIGGAVCPLGTFNAALQPASSYNSIDKKLTTPYTDPGTLTLGTLVIESIGIATPVSTTYQLGLEFIMEFPDPWFAEMQLDPPPLSEIAAAASLRTMEAAG